MTNKLTAYDIRVLTLKSPETGCWEWQGKLDRDGYGLVWLREAWHQAHREVYKELTGADIPSGMELDHLCLNRKCVNPEHLECVDKLENLARRWGKDNGYGNQT